MDYLEKNGDLTAIVDCPDCGVRNYIPLGDTQDQSSPNIDGGICFKCEHEWLFEGWDEVDPDLTLEDAILNEGKEYVHT